MKGYLQFAVVLLLFSCSGSKDQEMTDVEQQTPVELAIETIIVDTVLEHNAPNFLDSNQHQLFIDTTRNSKYFDQIANWQPHRFDQQATEFYLEEISEGWDVSKMDLRDFPREWISIHALNGEYVAYNPLNGIDWRFSLTDSAVCYYRMEADADMITSVVLIEEDELLLELRTIPQKREDQRSFLRIKKTKMPFLYSVQFADSLPIEPSEFVNLVTPLEHLNAFNLVVSDAPGLVPSTVGFDRVERKMVE